MPVDKSPTHIIEGAARPKQSSPLEMEALWSKLRSVYQEVGEGAWETFSPLTAGRIHRRTMVLNGQRSRRTRHSWNLAFSLAATFFLLLLVIPLVPSYPGAGEAERGGMRDLAAPYLATGTGTENSLPLEASLAPKVAPIPEPTSEAFETLTGMGGEGVRYDSVTLAFAAPEQIESLLPVFPEAQQYSDGTLLLAQGDQEAGSPQMETDLKSVPICVLVVFREAIQGTEEMPIGSDLLLLAPSSSSTPGQESWLVLAWQAFLATVWPWGLILALAALVSLPFYFRRRRLWWAGVFFTLLLLSLVLPLLSPVAGDDRLLLESADHLSSSLLPWPMPTATEAPLTILSAVENPPSDSPFTLPLGAPDKDLSLLLEGYGLRIEGSEAPVKTVQWVSLPASQLFSLQLAFLGLRALLLFVPLFLFGWLTFSRGLQTPALKSEDRLPKLL
ncbi:MAG: hypothetical protein NTV33_01265 [Coprothermobacterota bacterium]|nr:hypothetical protein [Coprothermobacterota bacterium]